MTTRLAWVTDPHFDHLRPWPDRRMQFAHDVASQSDCCVISGDISTYHEVDLLGAFARHYAKPIYFVLGNHDFWGASFKTTDEQIRRVCLQHENLTWLTGSKPIALAPGVELCGVDGWYDAEIGSWRDSSFRMLDWQRISDFLFMSAPDIVATSRHRAKGEAMYARHKLDATTAKSVFFVTHVPPFEESAMHEGKPSARTALPWYTSKRMGDQLSAWAEANPERELVTLCGHVHSPSEFQQAPNHLVLCGFADYGKPSIAKVFEL